MEMYTYKQMAKDLQHLLVKNPNFLDSPEIPADPYMLNLMSLGLRKRYYHESYLDDMKRALSLLEVAMQKATVASLDWLSSVHCLSRTCYLYYNGTSNIDYLNQAIRLSEQLIEHTDSKSSNLVLFLHYLASYLVMRARQTQSPGDIHRAVRAWRECIRYVPEASQDRHTYISRLFFCLLASHHLDDEIMNLDVAIDLLQLLLEKNSIEESKCPIMITVIADYMLKNYFQRGQLSDLNSILQTWEQAIQNAPSRAVYLPDLYTMLSISFLLRFFLLRNDDDLQKAVAKQEEALYLCKSNTYKYTRNLYSLGQTLMIRYYRANSLADLNHTIELFERALARLAGSSSMRPTYRKSLTEALCQRYARTLDPDDLQRIRVLKSQH